MSNQHNNLRFTVTVADAVTNGFSFTKFMESLDYFYFEPCDSWTNEDFQEWVKIKGRKVITTFNDNDGRQVINTFSAPKDINDALYIFNCGFWNQCNSEVELSQEEAEEIALNYSKYLLKGHL